MSFTGLQLVTKLESRLVLRYSHLFVSNQANNAVALSGHKTFHNACSLIYFKRC